MSDETPEARRLRDNQDYNGLWHRWGPYLSERQWGTVREDYSPDGTAWEYLSHDHARSRAYRWGEDGLLGVSDIDQRLCLSLALWNGRDPILKERLFGLTNREGNHGEDCKEYYYYLDALPSHAYLKGLYKYPQREFPYRELVEKNARRGKRDPEFELLDTGVFDDDRYFDVVVEHFRPAPDDLRMLVTVHNRGPEASTIHILPQLWFRNTWSWKTDAHRPVLSQLGDGVCVEHPRLPAMRAYVSDGRLTLFTDNDTNVPALFDPQGESFRSEVPSRHYKDAVHEYVVNGRIDAIRHDGAGTKVAWHHVLEVPPGASVSVRLRLVDGHFDAPFDDFNAVVERLRSEAEGYYNELQRDNTDPDARRVQRQAFAGMIWSKQYYGFDQRKWLEGDPTQPPPPESRKAGRNADWTHVKTGEVISMPDKWEYPWFAAWDTAFHCIALAMIDPEFAKGQLILLTREWYMHPNGQLPAYEWAFGDVNPPVHAWATWRVFQMDRKQRGGHGDLPFLERVFHKLMLNFTWWVNRKDAAGRNIFQGGFLGLDNIGVFDRSSPLPTGGYMSQADGTSWMAMCCLNMMRIALELALHNHVYEDIATKFFEHFLHIAEAMTNVAGKGYGLWDETDNFYYDVLNLPDGRMIPMRLMSMVGLIPLFAVETLEPELLAQVPEFSRRLRWFLDHRPDLAQLVSRWTEPGRGDRRLLSLLRGSRMKKLLRRMLDETSFLSDYGVRALSKAHKDSPYVFETDGQKLSVHYEPAESRSGLFGGNSNWRGPIWMPVNYLLIESMQRFHHYYGDDFKVECPTGSGNYTTLLGVAEELQRRLTTLFLRDSRGLRATFGGSEKLQRDPHFRDNLLFYEYFHGDTGEGLGASHQTGWTGLIAKLLHRRVRAPSDT